MELIADLPRSISELAETTREDTGKLRRTVDYLTKRKLIVPEHECDDFRLTRYELNVDAVQKLRNALDGLLPDGQ